MSNPLTSLVVALATAFLLFSFSGYQVTGDTAGPRLLGRLAASLVELERWVPAHRDDLQLLARDRPEESVLVDDLPVDVLLPSQQVLDADENGQALSDMLRDAMGRRLYEEGRGVLQDDAGQTHLGVTDPVRWAVTLLDADMHNTWRLALIASLLLTLLFAGSFVLARRSPLGAMAAGAALAAAVAAIAWIVARGLDSAFESAVDREIVLILRDGAWLGVRNSLAATAALLALMYLHRSLIAPRMNREDEYYWPEIDESQDNYPYDPA